MIKSGSAKFLSRVRTVLPVYFSSVLADVHNSGAASVCVFSASLPRLPDVTAVVGGRCSRWLPPQTLSCWEAFQSRTCLSLLLCSATASKLNDIINHAATHLHNNRKVRVKKQRCISTKSCAIIWLLWTSLILLIKTFA